jgi:hypothetical protein
MSLDLIKNPHEITPEEQEAWERLSNELIFTHHVGVPIAPEYVTEISEEIQDDFVELKEAERHQQITGLIALLDKHLGGHHSSNLGDQMSMLDSDTLKSSPQEFIAKFKKSLSMETSDSGYFGWGFTPKLASKGQDEIKIQMNCLGQAITLGGYCKKVGIRVEMGITPDHPYVIANIDGKKYLIDNTGEPKDLTDGLEQKDGYSIYRPQRENLEETQNRMIIIQDFDQAVLYQTLENFAVLSNLARDEHIYILPGSKTEGENIAREHREALLQTDWQELQTKLFPNLVKSFHENSEEWSKEIQRVKNLRVKQYKGTVLSDAFHNAIKLTSMKDTDFDNAFPEIIKQARVFKDVVMLYLRNGIEMNNDVPKDLILFFQSVREFIEKEDKQAKVILYNSIEMNLRVD